MERACLNDFTNNTIINIVTYNCTRKDVLIHDCDSNTSSIIDSFLTVSISFFLFPCSIQVPENYLKWGFGIMMVVLGSKTIYSAGPLKSMALSASKAKRSR